MYIEKSTVSKCIMLAGAVILFVVAFVYCFSDMQISGEMCMAIWSVCVFLVVRLVKKVESI